MRRVYFGWWMVVIAAIAMVGTLPGRSQGLGLITEPLLIDFGLDRIGYATINFWVTIVGSLGAIGVGGLIDRAGTRRVLTAVAALLGAAVIAMSVTSSVVVLVIMLTLTRALGQSALSVVSITMVGRWFTTRVDRAMATYSVLLSVGFMAAFPMVGAAVQSNGWRWAWIAVGLSLLAGFAPLAWVITRDNSAVAEGNSTEAAAAIEGHSWTEALGTGAFWVFAIGTALYGLIASGIGLFNESILAERGFGAGVYHKTLVVTAMTGLIGNFAGGWLFTRVSITRMMAVSLFVLAAGLLVLPHLTTMAAVMLWAAAMGLAGGLVMVLFFSTWPKVFGRRHLGRIQGSAQALTVLASACGPLLLAWGVEASGSYALMFRVLAAVTALTAVGAWLVTLPRPAGERTMAPA